MRATAMRLGLLAVLGGACMAFTVTCEPTDLDVNVSGLGRFVRDVFRDDDRDRHRCCDDDDFFDFDFWFD